MGSSPRDSSTMKSSSQGAQAADAQLAANAKQNQDFTNQARLKLFGTPDGKGGFSGGTLSPFLDPNSLNVSSPTGAYKTQYQNETAQIAQGGVNARGALARNLASRGFSAPNGFAADELRKSLLDQNSQQGQAFAANTMQSYQDALSNFWRASGALNGEGDTALSASISGDQAAANNYANLYGSASQPKPSVTGQIIGGGLQAGGAVGSAAVKCPCEGALMTMHDGSEVKVETLRKGSKLRGIDGEPCMLLADPVMFMRESVELVTLGRRHRASMEHTLMLEKGGYKFAGNARNTLVKTVDGPEHILHVDPIGKQPVYFLEIDGSHSYCADGFWALS